MGGGMSTKKRYKVTSSLKCVDTRKFDTMGEAMKYVTSINDTCKQLGFHWVLHWYDSNSKMDMWCITPRSEVPDIGAIITLTEINTD